MLHSFYGCHPFTHSHIHTFTRAAPHSHIHTRRTAFAVVIHSHIHTFTHSHIHTFTHSHALHSLCGCHPFLWAICRLERKLKNVTPNFSKGNARKVKEAVGRVGRTLEI